MAKEKAPVKIGTSSKQQDSINFSVKHGKTVYDVTAVFSEKGNETLYGQFKKLIMSA